MKRWIVPLLITCLFLLTSLPAFAKMPTEEHERQTTLDEIVEIVADEVELTTLAELLEEADLIEALEAEGDFTVFAPSDDAFESLPTGYLESLREDHEQLELVLSFHVITETMTFTDLLDMDGEVLQTLAGEELEVAVDGDEVTLDDTAIISSSIEASNGVLHIIDGVLVPPGVEDGTSSQGGGTATPTQGTSSQGGGTPTATQGTSSQGGGTPTATQGTSSQGGGTPTATQGTSSQGGGTPTATQGTSSQGGGTATPTQGTSSQGGGTPTATQGTSGGTATRTPRPSPSPSDSGTATGTIVATATASTPVAEPTPPMPTTGAASTGTSPFMTIAVGLLFVIAGYILHFWRED